VTIIQFTLTRSSSQPLARIDNSGKLTLLQAKASSSGRRADLDITLNPDTNGERAADHRRRLGLFLAAPSLYPKLGGEVASMFYDVENAEATTRARSPTSTRSAQGHRQYSFQVVTAKPAPQFRAVLALTYFPPRRWAQGGVEKVGEKWIAPENILSNGPYKLVTPARTTNRS